MGKKKHCRDCDRKKAEEQASRLMDSWLCFFDNTIWCPHDKVPKHLRVNSVCRKCNHFADFEAEMEKEEEEFFDMVDNPEKYGFGGV